MAHTYILYSEELDKYYVGSTADTLESRLENTIDRIRGLREDAQIGKWFGSRSIKPRLKQNRRRIRLKSGKAERQRKHLLLGQEKYNNKKVVSIPVPKLREGSRVRVSSRPLFIKQIILKPFKSHDLKGFLFLYVQIKTRNITQLGNLFGNLRGILAKGYRLTCN